MCMTIGRQALALLITLNLVTCNPNSWYVDPDSGDDTSTSASCAKGSACPSLTPYATITKAVASCGAGDEIRLRAGNYGGVGNLNVLLDRKTIDIVSDTGVQIVLDAQNQNRFLRLIKSTVSITNIRFSNGRQFGDGGAVFASDSPLTLTDVTMSSNQASTGDGGAIFTTGASPVTMTRCTFEHNRAQKNGGALSVGNAGTARTECSTCAFTNNSVYQTTFLFGKGGAIFTGAGLRITDGVFKANTAQAKSDSFGGAIAYEPTAASSLTALMIQTSSFIDSTARYGGALSIKGSAAVAIVNYANFTRNVGSDSLNLDKMPGYGGAVFAQDSSDLKVEDSKFVANSAVAGGALRVEKSTAQMTSCSLDENSVTSYGAAISVVQQGTVSLIQSRLASNYASIAGGAVHVYEASLTAQGSDAGLCEFQSNRAAESGGAISVTSPVFFNITGCSFSDNQALSTVGGGVVYSDSSGSDILFSSSQFTNNAAPQGAGGMAMIYAPAIIKFVGCQFRGNYALEPGGALSLESTSGSVKECLFEANYVTTSGKGGGSVAMKRNATTRFDNSRFESHHGDRATALLAHESSPVFTGCNFSLSSALKGIVEIVGREHIQFHSCSFHNNQASETIGIIFLNDQGTTLFSECRFADNFAPAANGAAVSVGASSTSTFDKSSFSNNTGYVGGAVHVLSPTTTIFTRSRFFRNTAQSGGAVYVAASAAARFEQNNFFDGNKATASNGGAIASGTDATVSVKESRFENNEALRFGGAIAFGNLAKQASGLTGLSVKYNKAGHAGGGIYWLGNGQVVEAARRAGNLFESNRALYYGSDQASDIATIRKHDLSSSSFSAGMPLTPGVRVELVDAFSQKVMGPKVGDGVRCTLTQEDSLEVIAGLLVNFSLQGEVMFKGMQFSGIPGQTYRVTVKCEWSQCVGDDLYPKKATLYSYLKHDECPLGHVVEYKKLTNGDKSTTNANCPYCKYGTFAVERGKEECTECYRGGNCTGGHHVFATNGYWKASAESGNVYRCRFHDACPGGEAPACIEGYKGRLCSECEDGYSKLRDECLKCGGDASSTFQQFSPGIFFLTAILLALIGYSCARALKEDRLLPTLPSTPVSRSKGVTIVIQQNPTHSSSRTGAGSGAGSGRLMRIPSSPNSSMSPNVPHTPGSPGSVGSYTTAEEEDYESDDMSDDEYMADDADTEEQQTIKDAERAEKGKQRITGMIKVLFSYAQVMCLIIIAMPVIPWPNLFVRVITPLQFAILDIFEMVPTGCMFGDIPFWGKHVALLLLFCSLCGVTMVRMHLQVNAKEAEAAGELAMGKKHSANACLEEAEEARGNNYRIIFTIIFLLYPVISTSSFEIFACRGIEDKWYLSQDLTVECYESPEWIVTATITGILLPVVVVGLPWFIFAVLSRNRHKLARSKQQGRYGFLYMSYTKECWYYEVVEMIRKLCQTSLVMFVMPGSNFQVGFALAVSYLFVALQFQHHPYEDHVLNQLQTVSLFAVTMTLFCGLMLKVFDSAAGSENETDIFNGYEKDFVEYTLYAVNALAMALMIKIVVQSSATFGVLAAKAVDKELDQQKQVRLMKAEAKIVRKKKAEKYVAEEVVIPTETIPMGEEWATPPEWDQFTEGVDTELFDRILNVQETASMALDKLPTIGSSRTTLSDECEGYIASCFSNRCKWSLVKFEEYRSAAAQTAVSVQGERGWPPTTEESLSQSRKDIKTAWDMAGLGKIQETLNDEFDQHFASSMGYNEHFMEAYSGAELKSNQLAQLKSHLRTIGDKLASQMANVGLRHFKGQLDGVLENAATDIKNTKIKDLDIIIAALFDRHSYDGEKLWNFDELNDLITGIIFKCQDILPPKSLDVATTHIQTKSMKSKLEKGMSCLQFTEWFRDNVVSPKTPQEKISKAVQEADMTQCTSETSTTVLIASFENVSAGASASASATKAKGKLQDRIAARRKKLQDKKVAHAKSLEDAGQ